MATQTAYGVETKVMLTPIWCCSCGTPFGFSEAYETQRRKDHVWFYCPNGHPQRFAGQTEAERLKVELKASQSYATTLNKRLDEAEASRRAFKGQVTKLRNRSIRGECPICGVHVYQLERHVTRQHPDEHQEPEVE